MTIYLPEDNMSETEPCQIVGVDGVTGTFVRPCQSCGRTVHVVDTVEQPHECAPAETTGEGLARAWWAGHAQGQFDAAVESTPDGEAVETDPYGSIWVRFYFDDADPVAECECGWHAHGDAAVDAFRAWWAHRAEHDVARPVVSSPVQVDGERPTLAELHASYLAARQHTLSTDGMDRDAAIEAQALYVLGEASELHAACKHGTGGWGGTARHWRCEIADVVLATVSLANILGVTVEDCIAEKTEEDRGRG